MVFSYDIKPKSIPSNKEFNKNSNVLPKKKHLLYNFKLVDGLNCITVVSRRVEDWY